MTAICFCDAWGVYHDATPNQLQAAHAIIEYYEEWPIGRHRSAHTWMAVLGGLEFWFFVWALPLIYRLAFFHL